MARVTTMAAYLWPLMDGCSVELSRCAVCGRTGATPWATRGAGAAIST